jgi:hypothetical protein
MNILLKFWGFKGIGLPIGWVVGMILQLIFFPMISRNWDNKFKADANWWIPQLMGLIITFIIVGFMNKKIVFPLVKDKFSTFISWSKETYNKFLLWLNN